MNIQPHFEELLQLLEENHDDYMIVGGYAVAFHGYPRFTKDIDFFFECSPSNIARLRQALAEFAFSETDMPDDLFATKGNIITFGVTPSRVDFINDIDGVSYADAKSNAVRGKYGRVEATFIGLEDLLRNKLATPRLQDKVDIEKLTKIVKLRDHSKPSE